MRRALAALVLVAALAAAVLYGAVRASLPRSAGALAVTGLEAPLAITYDAARRPYVRAESAGDALFAEGFLHATERLWQMELVRRAGRGRLSELLGSALLETDRALWRAGVPELAARLAASATPELLALVERYAAGVNAGIAALRVRPLELLLLVHAPAPWRAEDVFAVGAMIAFDSANNMRDELLRFALAQVLDREWMAIFLPDERELPGFPYAVEPAAALGALRGLDALDAVAVGGLPSVAFGSDGWAVAPARSASGRALFAFDSHDALALPNLFYEVHLFFGAESIRGWSVPGLPGVINGFNQRVAWGLTNIGDTQDLFLETRDPENPRRFRGPDGAYEAKREIVEIPVRGRSEPERLEILTTRNGRLVQDDPPLPLRWIGHDSDPGGLEALLAMNRARDWPSFRAAADAHFAPSANVTYADVDGRVAFRTIGRLPLRAKGDGLVPLRGDDPEAGWRGSVGVRDLPEVVDPPSGFVAAANARVTPPGRGPLVSADNAPGYRMRRITGVLRATPAAGVESMRALQTDWWNGQAALVLPEMLRALDALDSDARESSAREIVSAWARAPVSSPDAAAPLIFERWYLALARGVFAERLGEDLYTELCKRNYVLNHALGRWFDRGPFPWGGGPATVGRASYRYDRAGRATHAATLRVVAEMSDPPRAFAVIPGGQSGHPASAHYADQLGDWLAGRLHPLPATPDFVGGETLRLEPASGG